MGPMVEFIKLPFLSSGTISSTNLPVATTRTVFLSHVPCLFYPLFCFYLCFAPLNSSGRDEYSKVHFQRVFFTRQAFFVDYVRCTSLRRVTNAG